MKIPAFDLTRQYASIREEIDEAVERVITSGRFVLGEEVESLESEVAAFCGASHAVAVASGTDALHLVLRAIGVGAGDEVIVPAFTFIATAEVVVYCGATPVFADVEPDTLTISPGSVAEALTERTKAVIPVHLFGHPASMEELNDMTSKRGIVLVEDAAQAFGASYGGCKVGTLGLAACFSFFPTKNLGAFGDGGMIVTDDENLAGKIRQLRVHGASERYRHRMVGYNSRLDALQAAILRAKLPHVDAWNAARRSIAASYRAGLEGLTGLECPSERDGAHHVYHQYTIRLDGRDDLGQWLARKGIGTAVYYPVPLPLQEAFAEVLGRKGSFPETERASKEVLSLPMFPELKEEEVKAVVREIQHWRQGE